MKMLVIRAVFETETWAKVNLIFPSYHQGCFQEKRNFDFWRLLHHLVNSDNNRIKFTVFMTKKISSYIFVTQVSISNSELDNKF